MQCGFSGDGIAENLTSKVLHKARVVNATWEAEWGTLSLLGSLKFYLFDTGQPINFIFFLRFNFNAITHRLPRVMCQRAKSRPCYYPQQKIEYGPRTTVRQVIHSGEHRFLFERGGEMRICVFCGSNCGNNELYASAARGMGRTLAQDNIALIYGGGRVGLMGALADAALTAGGAVIGVMPRSLVEREIQHTRLSELHIVATMHERKTKMAEVADGFIALPGGAGTFKEIFEQWTWAQLGIHHKPCGFLNTNGYFDPLRTMIDRMAGEGFLRHEHASMLVFQTEPAAIIDAFRNYSPPEVKWQVPPNMERSAKMAIRIVAALCKTKRAACC